MNKKMILAMALATGLNAYANDVAQSISKKDLAFEKLKIEKIKSLINGLDNAKMGDLEGNGGDALVCGTGENQTVEFLDLFEADYGLSIFANPEDGQWELDLGSDDLTVIEKVFYALNKIKKVDIKRYQLYSSWAVDFESQIKYINDRDDGREFRLGDVADTGNVILPVGCELRQLLIQNENRVRKSFFYQVDKKLWDKLDSNHKAAVILHEVIYRDLFTQSYDPHTTSVATRHFNALLTSKQIHNYTASYTNYNDLLEGLNAYQKVNKAGFPVVASDKKCLKKRSYVYTEESNSLKCTGRYYGRTYYNELEPSTSLDFIDLPFLSTVHSEIELKTDKIKSRSNRYEGWHFVLNLKPDGYSAYKDLKFNFSNLDKVIFRSLIHKKMDDKFILRKKNGSSVNNEDLHSFDSYLSVTFKNSEEKHSVSQIVIDSKNNTYDLYTQTDPGTEFLNSNFLLKKSYDQSGKLLGSQLTRTRLRVFADSSFYGAEIYPCDKMPAEVEINKSTQSVSFKKGTCVKVDIDNPKAKFIIHGKEFTHDPDLKGVVGKYPATVRLEQNVKKVFKTKYKKGRIVRLNKDGKILGYK